MGKTIIIFAAAIIQFIPFSLILAATTNDKSDIPVSVSPAPNRESIVSRPSAKETTQIVVNVIINTESKGDFFAELDANNNVFISLQDVRALKLQYAEDKIVIIRGDEQYVPLNALIDVSFTFDEKKLTVAIIGKTTESGKTAADLFSLQTSTKNIYYPRETSAFINYGLNYAHTSDDGFKSFSVTNKLGLRTGDMFFTSDSLYSKTESSEDFTRLQSSATYERRGDFQWLVLGDQYASSGDLGSTVNMGGIGFSKVYRLDPYFITQPVMDLRGSVIFPTQAEIYLDGVLIGKQSIAPGSFDLKNLYSYTGSHNIEVLLKDPFGNVQKISYLAYFSTQLLRKGLHEYSYNAGFLREQYGVKSNEYGDPVFSAFHRYGVTNFLNIGARAETSDGLYNGGISVSFLVPRAGSFAFSLAGSSGNGHEGMAASFQHAYQLGSFSTNLLLRNYSRDYATVANSSFSDMIQYEINFGMGFSLNPVGSFSFSYSQKDSYNDSSTKVFSANYSRSLFKSISLFGTASAAHDKDTTYSFFVGLNFDFGKGIRGSAQVSGGSGDVNSETLQLQKDIPIGEGLGYRASLNRSETPSNTTTSFNPYVQYNAKYGIYSVNATIKDSAHGGTSELYDLSAAGSLVFVGGFFGASRPVNDSFGMVAVDRLKGATVLNNGQDMGKTGSSGMLVLPSLTSYARNQVTLDTKNIPIDYTISDVNRNISPSLWSGACVSFDVKQVRALTGKLYVEKEGKRLPLEFVEILIKAGEKNLSYLTGKDGEFYLENSLPEEPKEGIEDKYSCETIAQRRKSGDVSVLSGTYKAAVEYQDGTCEFSVNFPDQGEAITDTGDIQCVSPVIPDRPVENQSPPLPSPAGNDKEDFSARSQ